MKKTKKRAHRLVAFTLATSIIVPQASPAFAASLESGKIGVARLSDEKLTTSLSQGRSEQAKKQFPLLTLMTRNGTMTKLSTALVRAKLKTDFTSKPDLTDGSKLTVSVDSQGQEENGSSVMSSSILSMVSNPTLISVNGPEVGTEDVHPGSSLSLQEGNNPAETEENTAKPVDEETPETVAPEQVTDVDNTPGEGRELPLSGVEEATPPAGDEADETEQEPVPGEGAEGEGGDLPAEPYAPAEDPGPEEPSAGPEGDALPLPEEQPGMEVEALAALTPQAVEVTEQLYNYLLGYGLAFEYSNYTYLRDLKDYELRFRVELKSEIEAAYGSNAAFGASDGFAKAVGIYGKREYAYSQRKGSNSLITGNTSNGTPSHSYCIFPSAEMLGRVPDLQFDGWYLYPAGTAGAGDPREWIYSEDVDMIPFTPVSFTAADLEAAGIGTDQPYQNFGDTWDAGVAYGEDNGGYEAGTTSPKAKVSFVAKWRLSDESRALDIAAIKDESEIEEEGGKSTLESAATLTVNGEPLQLYSADIVGKYGKDLKDLETAFESGSASGDGTEYWLRVPADVDSLDLEFHAAEIFYSYFYPGDDVVEEISPVQIARTFAGETVNYSKGEGTNSSFTSAMLPMWNVGSYNSPNNSAADPAHSQWVVTNIALEHSGPAQDKKGYNYNDITITVAPPSVYVKQLNKEALTDADRAKMTTYTFHVQRLTEPTLTQSPGNTPAGMVMRDSRWNGGDDAGKQEEYNRKKKEVLKNFFGYTDETGKAVAGTYRFSTVVGDYPQGKENNSGTIFRDTYTAAAWGGGRNIDADETAIVVYLNSAFQDPGISLTDSEGNAVVIDGKSEWQVVRQLKLKTADELTISNLTGGEGRWYQNGKLEDTPGDGEVLNSSTQQIDLRGLKVLPGIYTLEYELVDPVADKKTYGSKESDYVTAAGKAGAANFSRTVVVLPIPGDVDMDGVVTSADAEVLRKNLTDAHLVGETMIPAQLGGVPLGSNPVVDLFAYRVADIDHDGTLDKRIENSNKTTDVDHLEALPTPQVTNVANARSDYYYIPLPNSVTAALREPLVIGATEEDARLELAYLGIENPRTTEENYKEGYVANPKGPWVEGGAWTTGTNSEDKAELLDTVWVGVKLTNGAASELLKDKDVDTFTFTLVYDVRFLEPTMVLTQNQWNEAASGQSGDLSEALWKRTLEIYNTGTGSQTVWGNSNDYTFTRALQSGRDFTTYDTKVITPLEVAANEEGRNSFLKELVFSVTLNDGANAGAKMVGLDDEGSQWLMAVPFKLVQHPTDQYSREHGLQKVEMEAGMSDFSLILSQSNALTTAGYGRVGESIFGGATQNLSTEIAFVNAGPRIPLGKDKSEVYYIRHEPLQGSTSGATAVVYSTPFRAQYGWTKLENGTYAEQTVPIPTRSTVYDAPAWLEYEPVSGTISGRPPEARPDADSAYTFRIANYRFILIVEQAPLHYWADSASSYYGETEYRGSNSGDFTFRYDEDDILSIEQERAAASDSIKIDGIGSGLVALLDDGKYQEPKFTAVDNNGQAIVYYTPARSNQAYRIESTVKALSTNYDLIYSPDRGAGAKGVSILPRPFQVEELTIDKSVGRIFSDQTTGVIPGLEAEINSSGKKEFTAQLMKPLETDEEGHYDGRPLRAHDDYLDGVLLPGDSIVLQYNAELLQNEADLDLFNGKGNRYALINQEEPRTAQISGLSIVGGTNSSNYTIYRQSEPLKNGSEAEVFGTVRRREVLRFDFMRVPPLVYYTGDQLERSDELRFNIVKEGETGNVEGTYPYNEETTFLNHGITVSWATKEEIEVGNIGLEYHQGQTFTMDYDGRFLCMSIEDAREPTGKRIVSWTDTPLTIIPRPLTLTAVETSRFYGEENGALHFTYDPQQLSYQDRQTLAGKLGLENLGTAPRDGEELKQLFAEGEYKPPTLTAVDDVTTRVLLTKETKYTGSTTNAVLIEGAWFKNYDVNYSYTAQGTTVVQAGWGASPFRIERRPIVVEALRATEKTQNLITIYADTKRLQTGEQKLSLEDVVLGLPVENGRVQYYPRYGATSPTIRDVGYGEGATPLVGDDQVSFTFTATVVSRDGQDYVKWTNFSKGHFNMSDADANGDKRYPVQVSDLTLTGADAGNYVLVYRENTSAGLGGPARWESLRECITPNVNARGVYYVPQLVNVAEDGTLTASGTTGQGTVTLRPIKSLQILSLGKQDYTYGEVYTPNQAGRNSNQGMQIYAEYETEYDNYLSGNVTNGVVEYRISHYEGDKAITSFDERGLAVYYQNGTAATAVDESRRLDYQQHLSIVPHDGVYLVVAGKRGNQTTIVQSAPSTDTLTVRPRALTLRADDQHRVYGEQNATPTFTFNAAELAPQDQVKLGQATGWVSSQRLAELDLGYSAPTFAHTATHRSDVRNGGQGGYAINLDRRGSLNNYELSYESGTLYIYPRRVKVDSFNKNSAANPIYTIYSDMSDRIVRTNVFLGRVQNETHDDFKLTVSPGEYRPAGAPGALPMDRSVGLVDGDSMTLRVEVEYPASLNVTGGTTTYDVTVQNAELVPGTREYGNYVLETTDGKANITHKEAKGNVELRSISEISIDAVPQKLHYTYGETLDLTGLIISISYTVGDDANNVVTNTIIYRQTDDFAAQGLYVNYYPASELLPEDKSESAWAGIRNKYYTAATGDHVTIAPTHDAAMKNAGDPKKDFAANGQYLIITAQRDQSHAAAAPVIVKARDGTPAQITVDPLPLTFTLAAEDKTYDATTEAAGTITFTNVFRQSGYVDSTNQDVTDVVYPVTGADYESAWAGGLTSTSRTDFMDYVNAHRGYVFTTGKYVPAGKAPLGENYPIDWTEGYAYSASNVMKFSFLDANVAYVNEPETHDVYGAITTKPVQLTGLRLAGPDAANYALSIDKVTQGNVSASNYQGSALPRATIHKANRPALTTELLPQVEIDPNTNVVRIVYDKPLSAIEGGEAAAYRDELHFEYALQYDATAKGEDAAESTPVVGHWAGDDGTATWRDERHYGGETVSIDYPEGYIPKEEDISKTDSNGASKGQVYQWAEEDPGFTVNGQAYPGGTEALWPNYYFYQTDRAALERDQIYWGLVRAAETHNYNASPVISSVKEYTPARVQAVLDAREAMAHASSGSSYDQAVAAMREASRVALEAVSGAVDGAVADAREESARMAEIAESGKWPEDWSGRAPAGAVKTYTQRLELISVKELKGAQTAPETPGAQTAEVTYQVPTLEAVWFTDVLEYADKKALDAVVRNVSPTRYQRYAWDQDKTATLFEGNDAALSLAEPFEVEITKKGEENTAAKEMIRVNENHIARIYVDLSSSGSSYTPVERVEINSDDLVVTRDTKPFRLTVTIYPAIASYSIRWTSSNEAVAVVDQNGQVTIVGLGTAVITAASVDGPKDSITITVVEDLGSLYPNGIFNTAYTDAFFTMDADSALFHPGWEMTRGETALLLAQFYMGNPNWTRSGPESFPDLSGEESYGKAAQLLAEKGVMVGLPDGSFAGEQIITRAEFIALLARMLGIEIPDTTGQEHAFLDAGEEDTWAYREIDAMSKLPGVLRGVGEGYFAPDRALTRAEAAAFLSRLLQFPAVGEDPSIPKDVGESHWARQSIIRAVNEADTGSAWAE